MGKTLLLLTVLAGIARADETLAPGSVLDQGNAPAAEALLSPEALAHYKAGDYRSTIGRWPDQPPWEPAFQSASDANAARFDVDERGTIVARDGGKPATGLYG